MKKVALVEESLIAPAEDELAPGARLRLYGNPPTFLRVEHVKKGKGATSYQIFEGSTNLLED